MTINPIVVQTGGESWIELFDNPPFGIRAIKTFRLPPDAAAGVTSIEDFAFYACSSLASIDIPAGVTSIGGYAFYGCSSLASIDIPAGVTSIGVFAIAECTSLASATLPEGLTFIGDGAFSGCSALMTMDVLSETPPKLTSSSLTNVPATCSIRVPADSVNAYKAAANWSARAAYITALP